MIKQRTKEMEYLQDSKKQLQRKVIPYLDNSTNELIEMLKYGAVEGTYFRRIVINREIYGLFGYDDSRVLCHRLLEIGIQRTHLSFQEIQRYLDSGKTKANLLLKIYGDGSFIDSLFNNKKPSIK